MSYTVSFRTWVGEFHRLLFEPLPNAHAVLLDVRDTDVEKGDENEIRDAGQRTGR